jgi:hypothetical protein
MQVSRRSCAWLWWGCSGITPGSANVSVPWKPALTPMLRLVTEALVFQFVALLGLTGLTGLTKYCDNNRSCRNNSACAHAALFLMTIAY